MNDLDYRLAIIVLPVIGSLLVIYARVRRMPINLDSILTLVGAFLIFISFMISFYNLYIASKTDTCDHIIFWLIVAIPILAAVGFIVSQRLERKTEKKADIVDDKEATETAVLLVDEPITLKQQDRLNSNDFASQFAQVLLGHDDRTCLVAALQGRWGSGKSSLLNLIEGQLRQIIAGSDDYIIIRFNPWNISSLDQLIVTFFHELKIAVGRGKRGKVNKERTAKLLDVLGGILTAGKLSPIGSQYFEIGGNALKKAGEMVRKEGIRSPIELKRELDDALSKAARRIFILIDDIDRLDQDAMRLLFRMIRLNADFRNATYLLAFDLQVVKDLLDPDQPGHAQEYIEKIVQLPANIPSIDEALLRDIIGKELDRFIVEYGEAKFDRKRWQELAFSGQFFKFFTTVRDVVRYVNGLRLNYPLVADEVDMVDFMAIESVRVFAPEAHYKIGQNKEILLRTSTAVILQQQEDLTITKKILADMFSGGKSDGTKLGDLVEKVCKVLFPQLGRVYGNTIYGSQAEAHCRQHKRICSSDMFDKYFILGIPKGELSDGDMRATLVQSKDRITFAKAVDKLFEKQVGRRFLERMEDYIDEVPADNVGKVISGLFDLEDRLVGESRTLARLSADSQAAWLIYLLLRKVGTRSDRKNALIRAIQDSTNLFMPVYLMTFIAPENGKSATRDEMSSRLEFSDSDISELRTVCVDKIRAAAEAGSMAKSPHMGMILYRWERWGNPDDAKEYAKKLIGTDEGVMDLVAGFQTEVMSDGERRIDISKKGIAHFVDLSSIETKVNDIKKSKWDQLAEQQKELVDTYLSGEALSDRFEMTDE